ncbi:efflux RND transporter periplasmic adaptor subunit [Roseateles cavernae]|uniref:efflux RND transporter periplasmic adaptor subunit n=1 Tax=Roseateles cavernae TaxID=3153578 RepID=UPI0032E41D27
MLRTLMTSNPPPLPGSRPPSGATMDRPLRPGRRWLRLPSMLACGLAIALTAAVLAGLAALRAPVLQRIETPQLAMARAGEFRDELALRARVEPLRSVQLDATEAGRVEAVLAGEGERVAAGAPLYRLHSPEQEQLLIQRGAEVAQQMANASVQRSAQAASLAQHRRERLQLRAQAEQAEAELRRQAELATAGFLATAALEQARRQRDLAVAQLAQAHEDQGAEAAIRAQSLAEMDRAVARLQNGLDLLARAQQRLLQRAPIAGQLSGFNLQPGASVRPGDRLGRIDDVAGGLRLAAEVDEFYLPRLQPGLSALSETQGALYLAQTLPQVQGGKVRVLLHWPEDRAPAALRPGQAVELRLHFSAPRPALLLPDGPGVQSRLYVREGDELRLRDVRLGQRAAGLVEVLAGLRAGEQVLVSQPPANTPQRLVLP